MSQKAMFITDRTTLQSAKRLAHTLDFVIPAHQQLGILAQQNNLKVISGDDLVSPTEYEEYAELVSNDLYIIEQAIKDNKPPDFVSIALATLAKKLHLFHLFSKLENTKNVRVINSELASVQFKSLGKYFNLTEQYYCHPLPTGDYYLDFQSSSGHKTGIFNLPQNTYSILPQNIFKALISSKVNFKGSNKIILTIPKNIRNSIPTAFYETQSKIDPKVFEQIERSLIAMDSEFYSTYTALNRYFRRANLPKIVYFSMVKNPYMAASMFYFKSKNIPIYMQTHGGLLEFGSRAQKYISAKLSEGIYNCPPSASKVFIRALTQVSSIRMKDKIVCKKINLDKILDTNAISNNETKILVALNFTNWGETCWGLSSTCYDTVKVLEHVSKLALDCPQIQWQIRLKFSIMDKPTKRDVIKLQGLDLKEINRIFNGIPNIKDVSHDSYEALLRNCDAVITEGITSVPFDAWENGKPVIFLKSHSGIRGSHPATLKGPYSKYRSPYYVETIESFNLTRINEIIFDPKKLSLRRSDLENILCLKSE